MNEFGQGYRPPAAETKVVNARAQMKTATTLGVAESMFEGPAGKSPNISKLYPSLKGKPQWDDGLADLKNAVSMAGTKEPPKAVLLRMMEQEIAKLDMLRVVIDSPKDQILVKEATVQAVALGKKIRGYVCANVLLDVGNWSPELRDELRLGKYDHDDALVGLFEQSFNGTYPNGNTDVDKLKHLLELETKWEKDLKDASGSKPTQTEKRNMPDTEGEKWKRWREALPVNVAETVPAEFQEALDAIAKNREKLQGVEVQPNRAAVILSAWNARNRLPSTVKEMVQQMRANGLWGDVFVVLNDGGGDNGPEDTAKLFWEDVGDDIKSSEELAKLLGVDRINYGAVARLGTGSVQEVTKDAHEKHNVITAAIPRYIGLSDSPTETKEGEVVLRVIEQPREGNDNKGKLRSLRDVYNELCITLYGDEDGGRFCPQYAILIDDETRLRKADEITGEINTTEVSGLDHILTLSEGGKVWVGARNALRPFNADGDPMWNISPPPLQAGVEFLHGKPGAEWLPGGATLCDFKGILAINKDMTQRYPGLKTHDGLLSTVARTLGVRTIVDRQTVHANQCPSNEQDAHNQMLRWIKGIIGMDKLVGPVLNKIHTDFQALDMMGQAISGFVKGEKMDIPRLITALWQQQILKREARKEPLDVKHGAVDWAKGAA